MTKSNNKDENISLTVNNVKDDNFLFHKFGKKLAFSFNYSSAVYSHDHTK